MDFEDRLPTGDNLEGWVIDQCDSWRDHYETNYSERFEEYYRLWRGIWNPSDRLRDSERSRLIAPALQQAVESSVAEVEEATFGKGQWFDIKDDLQDQNPYDVQVIRNQLQQDFDYCGVRSAIGECILNAAVYGTGIGEIVLEEKTYMAPATQPVMEGAMQAYGVNSSNRFIVKLRPVQPQNFLIDPVAASIDEALGVAIDEYVPKHIVEQGIEDGIYREVQLEVTYDDTSLEPDQEITTDTENKVRLTKYYGLVPREHFEDAINYDLEEDEIVESEEDSKYVEAIVVIANGSQLLKVEANPYMMQDRPVVAFNWDVVPNRFWGRGVCEKGYNSQKALDTELRARIDALALTVHPMMAIDASRLPRGMKPEIRPGKMLLTNGNPAEILQPFNFGKIDQVTFAQSKQLQDMVQQSTGAVDTTAPNAGVVGERTAAGISMSLGAIIKRHKRTLVNFQDHFLVPFVRKAAHRYMQFDPELYPVQDFTFTPSSSLGIVAREYEVTQLVQLLQTMQPNNPVYPTLLQSIVDNMNVSNREEILKQLQEAQQPNPQAQQMQMQAQQMQMQMQQLEMQLKQAELAKTQAETRAEMFNAETNRLKVLTTNLKPGDEDEKEFQRRAKVAELMLKERSIASDERIVEKQMREG